MAVHAHPDDESSKGAATMARYVREGASVLVCTLTGGERGRHPEQGHGATRGPGQPGPPSGGPRWTRAREILGVEPAVPRLHRLRACPRATRCRRCPRAASRWTRWRSAARPLVQAVREFRPHVILTYDENGGYPHPDHIKTHQVAVEAFEAAGRPGPVPGLRRALAAAQALLLPDLPPGPAAWRCTRRWSGRGLESPVRRAAGRVEGRPGRAARAWRSPPGCRAPTTSPSGTRPCWPTRPRSTRRLVVRLLDRGPARRVADRGLSSGQVSRGY